MKSCTKFENLRISVDAPAGTITLNRPQVRNALSADLVRELNGALDELEQESEVAAVILTGAGRAFCAGLDLGALRQLAGQPVARAREDSLRLMELFRRLYRFPKPTLAAVNGAARGGGCGLASVCDIVLAAEEASFAYPELKVGFVPALVSVFLLQICGEKKARELLLTGRTFSAAEACRIGLVSRVVAAGQLMAEARRTAEEISQNSPGGVQLTKQLLGRLPGLSLDQALEMAVELNALVRTSEDFREGVSAFLEKRAPSWRKSF